MSKTYWVATYRAIHDPAKCAEYVKLAGPAYAAALRALGNAVGRDIRIVEGV